MRIRLPGKPKFEELMEDFFFFVSSFQTAGRIYGRVGDTVESFSRDEMVVHFGVVVFAP